MHIDEAVFVVVDTETTGSSESDRIIEIGAVRVQGGTILDTYSRLINPERAIPSFIQRLTGITTSMVIDAPPMEEVLPEFLDFLGDGVFVAHNLNFDWRMLVQEAHRTGLALPEVPLLCTLRLARRLLPALPSKGLKALCAHFQIPLKRHHRALADAEATAGILIRLLEQARRTQQLEDLDALLAHQHRTYRKAGAEPRHIRRIREEVLPQLPTTPGVYFFKDGRGNILYIGKARQLQARVMSYFNGLPAQEERLQRLVRAVRHVEWQEVETELDALLLESRLIKEHRPRFNRQQKRYRQYPFLRLTTDGPFPALMQTPVIRTDGGEYYGPFRNRKEAERILQLVHRLYRLRTCSTAQLRQGRECTYASMGRCLAPCVRQDAEAYGAEVERVRAFLTGKATEVLEEVREAMLRASAAMAYEEAQYYKVQLEALSRTLERQRVLAHPISRFHALLILPIEEETCEVVGAYAGRPVFSLRLPWPLRDEAWERIGSLVNQRWAAGTGEAMTHAEEVDRIRLLAHWMFTHRERLNTFVWQEHTPLHTWLKEIAHTLNEQEELRYVE